MSRKLYFVGLLQTTLVALSVQADPPNPDKIPEKDLLGATVVLLACSYRGKRFLQVGYYVNNEYADEQMQLEPPEKVQLDKVVRNILADNPRVTRFPIPWEEEDAAAAGTDGPETSEAADGIRSMETLPLQSEAAVGQTERKEQTMDGAGGQQEAG